MCEAVVLNAIWKQRKMKLDLIMVQLMPDICSKIQDYESLLTDTPLCKGDLLMNVNVV